MRDSISSIVSLLHTCQASANFVPSQIACIAMYIVPRTSTNTKSICRDSLNCHRSDARINGLRSGLAHKRHWGQDLTAILTSSRIRFGAFALSRESLNAFSGTWYCRRCQRRRALRIDLGFINRITSRTTFGNPCMSASSMASRIFFSSASSGVSTTPCPPSGMMPHGA